MYQQDAFSYPLGGQLKVLFEVYYLKKCLEYYKRISIIVKPIDLSYHSESKIFLFLFILCEVKPLIIDYIIVSNQK